MKGKGKRAKPIVLETKLKEIGGISEDRRSIAFFRLKKRRVEGGNE